MALKPAQLLIGALALSCGLCVVGPACAQTPGALDEWALAIDPGDTLIALAARWIAEPRDWRDLQRYNVLANPRRLVPGTTLRVPSAWLRRQSTQAQVVFVQGDASYRSGKLGPWLPLVTGATLVGQDALRTGPGAAVSLRFADGSRLLVVPESEVRLEQLQRVNPSGQSEIKLRLERGNVYVQVQPAAPRPPSFEVVTPSVHLGVRGTEFRAHASARDDAQAGASRAEVLHGQVAAGAGDTPPGAANGVRIDAGFGVVAQPGVPLSPPLALLPSPDLADLPGLVERLPLHLAWQAQDGATGYRAQVLELAEPESAAGQDPRLRLDGRFAQPQAQWDGQAQLPDGNYLLRVRGVGPQGLEGADATRPFRLKARPIPPLPRQPGASALLRGGQVNLAWDAAATSARQRLQVATTADFAAPLFDNTLPDRSASLTLSLAPGRYHWRLASIDDRVLGQGPFGDAQSFELRAPLASPALVPPQLSADGLLLRWPAQLAGQSVQVQLANEAEFQQPWFDQQTTDAQLQVPTPPAGFAGTFYIRARTLDSDGSTGEFGATRQLQIPPSSWRQLLPFVVLMLL